LFYFENLFQIGVYFGWENKIQLMQLDLPIQTFFAILKLFSSLFIYFVFFCETKHPIDKIVFQSCILHDKHAMIVIL